MILAFGIACRIIVQPLMLSLSKYEDGSVQWAMKERSSPFDKLRMRRLG